MDQHRYALGIDSEGTWAAADADPALLDCERRGDADGYFRLNPDILAGADGPGSFAFAFDTNRSAGLDRGRELDVELAWTGEVDWNAREPGRLQPLQLTQGND